VTLKIIKKDDVTQLQEYIEKSPNAVKEIDTTHNFTDGQYIRQVFIPAGMVVIGKRHRRKTLNVVLKGKCRIRNSDEAIEHVVEAPYMYESNANVKKAVFAITDTVFANIHVTDEKDLDKIETKCIITEDEYAKLIEMKE